MNEQPSTPNPQRVMGMATTRQKVAGVIDNRRSRRSGSGRAVYTLQSSKDNKVGVDDEMNDDDGRGGAQHEVPERCHVG